MEINDSQKSELEELLSINRYMGYDQYMLVFKFVMKVKGFQIIQENQVRVQLDFQWIILFCYRISSDANYKIMILSSS